MCACVRVCVYVCVRVCVHGVTVPSLSSICTLSVCAELFITCCTLQKYSTSGQAYCKNSRKHKIQLCRTHNILYTTYHAYMLENAAAVWRTKANSYTYRKFSIAEIHLDGLLNKVQLYKTIHLKLAFA